MYKKFKIDSLTTIQTNIFRIKYESDGKKSPKYRLSESGLMTIFASKEKPFYWEGCSPKINFFGKWIGAWDGDINPDTNKPSTFEASLQHDIMYLDMPKVIGRKKVDKAFYFLIKKNNFKFAKAYYLLVRIFGWIWWYLIP